MRKKCTIQMSCVHLGFWINAVALLGKAQKEDHTQVGR